MKLIACSTIAGPAALGLPALNGGSGSYSIASCVNLAASSPRNFASSTRPKSIPAVTPPPVSAPYIRSASRADQGEGVLYLFSKPAAPSSNDPLHTDVMYLDRVA